MKSVDPKMRFMLWRELFTLALTGAAGSSGGNRVALADLVSRADGIADLAVDRILAMEAGLEGQDGLDHTPL